MFCAGIRCGPWQDGIEVALFSGEAGSEQAPASRVVPYPEDIRAALAGIETAQSAGLKGFGNLHAGLGRLMAQALREELSAAHLAAKDMTAVGCQGYRLPEGLALGDMTLVSQDTALPVIAVTGEDRSALECARQVAVAFQDARQPEGDVQPAAGLMLTETSNPRTADLDMLPTLEMLRRINAEDARVPEAVALALPQLAQAVDRIAERMDRGGRLIYVGAGTSGRLGVLDASEIPPTYGLDPRWVVGVIAGGERAIRGSVEDAEDDEPGGAQAVAALEVGPLDSVVGIAASGRTPFVLGALVEARRRGALTISMACNAPAVIEAPAEIHIALLVGPEVITGSTRMKAGTAQKLALNMLSTGVMVRLGKTYGNYMVDVRATNQKLRIRARRIVAQVCKLDEDAAGRALEAAGGEVKTAIVASLAGISSEAARQRLAVSRGVVRSALTSFRGE